MGALALVEGYRRLSSFLLVKVARQRTHAGFAAMPWILGNDTQPFVQVVRQLKTWQRYGSVALSLATALYVCPESSRDAVRGVSAEHQSTNRRR